MEGAMWNSVARRDVAVFGAGSLGPKATCLHHSIEGFDQMQSLSSYRGLPGHLEVKPEATAG